MNLKELAVFCKEKMREYPTLRVFIIDIYRMAKDECEEFSSSETHECELAVDSINDAIEGLAK